MALNSFAMSGGGIVAVGTVPVGIAIAGPTIVITNLGSNTVFGSCGGSAASAVNMVSGAFVTGVPVPAGAAGNANTGTAGIAITPFGLQGDQVVLATGGQGFLWLATLAGNTSVNVACGT